MTPDIASIVIYEDRDIIVANKPAGLAVESARVTEPDLVRLLMAYAMGQGCVQSGMKDDQHGRAQSGMKEGTHGRVQGGMKDDKHSRAQGGMKDGTHGRVQGGAQNTIFPVHRLDQVVGGILVFARNGRAAAELSKQLTDGTMRKLYRAKVCGPVPADEGELVDYLIKDGRTNTSRVATEQEVKSMKGKHAPKKAILLWKRIPGPDDSGKMGTPAVPDSSVKMNTPAVPNSSIKLGTPAALDSSIKMGTPAAPEPERVGMRLTELEIELKTGRHHQIRVQLANAGMPIAGDRKYGAPPESGAAANLARGEIALMSASLTFRHPASHQLMTFNI